MPLSPFGNFNFQAVSQTSLKPHPTYLWTRFRKQVAETLVSGWVYGDDQASGLLVALSTSRLVNGAVVTEAYESKKRVMVRLFSSKCRQLQLTASINRALRYLGPVGVLVVCVLRRLTA